MFKITVNPNNFAVSISRVPIENQLTLRHREHERHCLRVTGGSSSHTSGTYQYSRELGITKSIVIPNRCSIRNNARLMASLYGLNYDGILNPINTSRETFRQSFYPYRNDTYALPCNGWYIKLDRSGGIPIRSQIYNTNDIRGNSILFVHPEVDLYLTQNMYTSTPLRVRCTSVMRLDGVVCPPDEVLTIPPGEHILEVHAQSNINMEILQ